MRKIAREDLKTRLNYMQSDFKYNDTGRKLKKRKKCVMQTLSKKKCRIYN